MTQLKLANFLCPEITAFTINKILRLPKQFSPSKDLFQLKKTTYKFAQEEFTINALKLWAFEFSELIDMAWQSISNL